MPHNDILATIHSLEESLWREETRFDTTYMKNILSGNFVEIGRSGKIYDREAILAAAHLPINAVIPLPELQIRLLADSIALVIYDSHIKKDNIILYAHRSSIWSLEPDGWKLQFHQGTPFDPAA